MWHTVTTMCNSGRADMELGRRTKKKCEQPRGDGKTRDVSRALRGPPAQKASKTSPPPPSCCTPPLLKKTRNRATDNKKQRQNGATSHKQAPRKNSCLVPYRGRDATRGSRPPLTAEPKKYVRIALPRDKSEVATLARLRRRYFSFCEGGVGLPLTAARMHSRSRGSVSYHLILLETRL